MTFSWDRSIARADRLATGEGSAGGLLTFYAALLRAQRRMFDQLGGRPLSGDLAADVSLVESLAPALLRTVADAGPSLLANEARRLLASPAGVDSALLEWWVHPSDTAFFGKAVLQPYARRLADLGKRPAGRPECHGPDRCPFCGGAPQASILHAVAMEAEGGGRALMCSTCFTEWSFGRLLCASCGEQDERQLGYFQAPPFDHIRIETCDTCRRYIKGVDLTRLGTADPLVDDVASAPLDLWAVERGYTKIELNLVGL
jgi:formate dehydrogenase accessory protein FdhE